MNTLRHNRHPHIIRWLTSAALLGVSSSGCVILKSTHCEFVKHVEHSAENYTALATKSGDGSDQADAKQMKGTVQAELARCQ